MVHAKMMALERVRRQPSDSNLTLYTCTFILYTPVFFFSSSGSRDRYESDRFRDGPRRDDRYGGRDRYDDRDRRDRFDDRERYDDRDRRDRYDDRDRRDRYDDRGGSISAVLNHQHILGLGDYISKLLLVSYDHSYRKYGDFP